MLCVVPGEVWGGAVLRYFLALEEGQYAARFSPELQGFTARRIRTALSGCMATC
nr:Ornithine decarboxylase, constitutive [Klebsiella pneumoniae]